MALALSGCTAAPYYWQAASGQLELWQKSRPIDDWLADPDTKPELKARLRQVQEIRSFASDDLGLPDNGSYRTFAELGRPYVVWNVFAAPELSLQPVQWCFPVAGCVTYRGYFAEQSARGFADGLKAEGYDTYVGGVPAYSTLGWFDDPVPSTVIGYPDTELARLIFHELAHQVVYVKDDTTFNESFATAVEQEGVRRWVEAQGSPEKLVQFERGQARKREFIALVIEYQGKLTAIYASDTGDDEKRALKAQTLAAMREDYAALKRRWGMPSGYDAWIAGPLNNAQIASVASYTQQVPAFQALLAQEQGDLGRFYAAAKQLAKLPKAERDARLAELAAQTKASG
ncbi:MAG: aminopeptidase [Betaproteobacteria bacterium]|nr:aminopeptidase [Betaproteobacteria bacterium]